MAQSSAETKPAQPKSDPTSTSAPKPSAIAATPLGNSTAAATSSGSGTTPPNPLPTPSSGTVDPEPEIDLSTQYIIINGQRAHPQRLLARYKTTASEQAVSEALERVEFQARTPFTLTPTIVLLKSKKEAPLPVADEQAARALGSDMQARIKELLLTGQFEYVEPDYIRTIDATPSDAAFTNGTLWGLRNTGQSGGVANADIDAVRAWDITTGSTAVIVAVIDTGIRYTHQDLTAQMWRNPGEIAGNAIDDDGDGYVDNVYGINAINNTGDPMDDQGHGTHCAGTIGASANGGGQHVGVAWSVRLMACKFISASTGKGSTSDAIKCINFAVSKGARILSNSWGGGGFSQALADSISAAGRRNALFVAAAGNDGADTDSTPSYPASYGLDNIISIAAIDRQDKLASFSNYGLTSVDLGAPGANILSTAAASDSSYETLSGTSMAAPHASGAAALVLAKTPDLSAIELKQRMLSGTVPTVALTGKTVTGGRLNAYNALNGTPDGTLEVTVSPRAGSDMVGGTTVPFYVSVRDFTAVTNATVTARIAEMPAVIFSNNGSTPDAAASDNIYSASITVPSSGLSFTIQFSITAPGKTESLVNCTYPLFQPPANDYFASRTTITGATTSVTGSSVGATREPNEPNHADRPGAHSVWWSWTAPANGTVSISTSGSNFDTVLGIYTGTNLSSLVPIAGDDDSGDNQTSRVSFKAVSGTIYQIAVDGFSGASGRITLSTSFVAAPIPPANDAFANAAALSGTTTAATAKNQLATKEAGEPNHAGNRGGHSVWWYWTAPSSGVATIKTDGSNFDTTLGVYVGTSVSTLTPIVSDNDSGEGTRSEVVFGTVAGTTYWIAVDGFDNSTGDIALTLLLSTEPPIPANDDFASRIILSGSIATGTGTNIGASREANEPDHAGNSGGKSVWWSWTAPTDGTVTLTTTNSTFDTLLAVYTGSSLDALTLVSSNDQDSVGGSTSRVIFNVTAGTTYQIAVDGMNSGLSVAVGSVSLSVSLSPVLLPPNDFFSNRITITAASTTVSGSNINATQELGEPYHYTSSATKSVWWSWTAPTSGTAVITTVGSTFDTALAIYTGSAIYALTSVTSDDDSGGGRTSQVVFPTTAGTQYQIAVAGLGGASGSITLNVNPVTPPPIIDRQPVDQSPYLGDTILLSVFAHSSTPASYQWQKSTDNGLTFTTIVGADKRSLVVANSQLSDSGLYRVIITNPGGSVTSEAATVTVTTPPAPVITTQPVSQTGYIGDSFQLSATTSFTGPTTFQWQKSSDSGVTFTDIPGGASSYFWITSSTAGDAGQYRVIITNPGGSTTSAVATLAFTVPPVPVISAQPQDRTLYLGASLSLSVTASYTGETTFQWQKSSDNGVTFANISYATSYVYNVYSSEASDAGKYRVIITNPGGSTTSTIATVSFIAQPAPVISFQPVNQNIYLGGSINLSVRLSSSGSPSFQWQKSTDDGATFTDIAGATYSSYNNYNAQASDAGKYRVIVTNLGGSVTSNAVTVTFVLPPPPVITTQPVNQTFYAGGSISLYVAAEITGTTSFQWQRSTDGGTTFVDIANANYSNYNNYRPLASDAGQYRVIVTNPGGSTTSNVAEVTVSLPPLPVFSTQPISQNLYVGATLNLSVSVSSVGMPTCQWQKSTDNGATFTDLAGATSSYLYIYRSQVTDSGQYRAVITNAGGSIYSNTAIVMVYAPPLPVITTQPASKSVYLGETINLSVGASNTGPNTFQWQKSTDDGATFTDITYSTDYRLYIYQSRAADAGQYRVIVTNASGSTTSNVATVTFVLPPLPVISRQPASQSLYLGQSINLSVNASITGSTTYQWQKSTDNGTTFVAIANAVSSSFSISTSKASDAGQYRVIVTNPGGSVTSNAATLDFIVPPLPVISRQPANQNIYRGDSTSFSVAASVTGTTTYQWQKSTDGGTTFVNITGATDSYLSFSSTIAGDVGEYRVIVTNPGGSTTSNAATLAFVIPPLPVIFTQPVSPNIYQGDSLSLYVHTSSTGATTYQWQKSTDGGVTFLAITGATDSSFGTYSTTASDAGKYRVVVTNPGGSVTSDVATVAFLIPPPPTISTHPSSRTVEIGSSIYLSGYASGRGTITYQWQKDGVNLVDSPRASGFTSYSLYIGNSIVADSGQYRLVATNAGGSATSNAATITVAPPPAPVIWSDPVSVTVFTGSTVYLSVNASGTRLTCQWQKDGVNLVNDNRISGVRGFYLSISEARVSDAGEYRAIVSNEGGSVQSAIATLTVTAPAIPSIVSPSVAGAAISEPFIYTISATNRPTSFSATGLPGGLYLNSETGTVTGAPTVAGTYTATIGARNSIGTGTSTLSLLVLPATTVTTYAGKLGENGSLDSAAAASARFNYPAAVVADPSGVLYVADSGNHTIRKIALSGEVTTLAGQAGVAGSLDGTGLNAQFNSPGGIALDSSNNLYVADTENSVIRKITPTGLVSTLAGAAGVHGQDDGIGSVARFNRPHGLAADSNDNLYVADTNNHTLRKISLTSSPTVSTIAGQAGSTGSTDGITDSARFNFPISVAVDGMGNLYVADNGNHSIRQIATSSGTASVSTLAGSAGHSGILDGVGALARFNAPAGIAADRAGNVYVADTTNHTIRQIVTRNKLVITLAGTAGAPGGADGSGRSAGLNFPCGLAVDATGALFFADTDNHAIRVAMSLPAITTQPQSQAVIAGASVSFVVVASGQPSYQWYKNNIAITGATSPTLALSNLQASDAGSYKVTVSNALGSTTSNSATLTVDSLNPVNPTPPPAGGGGGGGGGGAVSEFFLAAMVLLALVRKVHTARRPGL